MTSNQAAERKLSAFSNSLFSSLAETITEACGSTWQIVEQKATEWTQEESEPVRTKLALEGGLRGEVTLEFFRSDAVMLAAQVLQQPAVEFEGEHAEAFLKMIEAAASRFASALAPEYNELTITASAISTPPLERADVIEEALGDEENNHITIRMYANSELSEALFLRSQIENAVSGGGKGKVDSTGKMIPEGVNLSLVMDVELNVTLRFGQRQLSLREILDLTTGSVVELDRQVEEPVELLLDGTVIARGEAVVIDGNYGLRVTEVSKPASTQAFN